MKISYYTKTGEKEETMSIEFDLSFKSDLEMVEKSVSGFYSFLNENFCCDKAKKDKAIRPQFREILHGIYFCTCPACKKDFDIYAAYLAKNRCPHCGQLFDMGEKNDTL